MATILMESVIHLRSAIALAGQFPVLAGVDLTVRRGETLVLRGPNGAGKTSLLRVCCGLQPVSQGQAVVLGHDLVADRSEVRRKVGFLNQAGFLYDELTVAENVRFAVRASGGRKDRVIPALERCGLGGRLQSTAASKLSTGQRRRAALAVLVARWPELWLLDEPHAGLDAGGRDLVDGLVREARERGVTVLLASHEHDRAAPLADRIVLMAGGQVMGERAVPRQAALFPDEDAPVAGAPAEPAPLALPPDPGEWAPAPEAVNVA